MQYLINFSSYRTVAVIIVEFGQVVALERKKKSKIFHSVGYFKDEKGYVGNLI